MPASWAQYLKDAEKAGATPWRQECSAYPLAVLSRDTENAAVVDIVAIRKDGEGEQVSTVRLVKRLKRSSFWDVGTTRDVPVSENTENRQTLKVAPGVPFIMRFSHRDRNGTSAFEVLPDSGGALSMTARNLEEVQRGIDEDYLAARRDKE